MRQDKNKNNLLTPEQVAEILQVHLMTIYGYIRRGTLDAIRLGRSYRIIPEDLTRFIESNRIKKAKATSNYVKRVKAEGRNSRYA